MTNEKVNIFVLVNKDRIISSQSHLAIFKNEKCGKVITDTTSPVSECSLDVS